MLLSYEKQHQPFSQTEFNLCIACPDGTRKVSALMGRYFDNPFCTRNVRPILFLNENARPNDTADGDKPCRCFGKVKRVLG